MDLCRPHCLSPAMQERAICKIVELMSKHAAQEPRTLFVMGSYRIGKERAYLGAAKALGYRCHVNADKLRVSAPASLQALRGHMSRLHFSRDTWQGSCAVIWERILDVSKAVAFLGVRACDMSWN